MTQLSGTLASLKIYRGTWGRGILQIASGGTIPVVGTRLTNLKKGGNYLFDGEITQHATYGEQFDVASVKLADGSATSLTKTAAKRAPRRAKAAADPDKPAPMRRKVRATGARKSRYGKRAASYVPDGFMENDPQKARLQRIENAAYEWAQGLAATLTPAQREVSIHTHLCETHAWAELGDVVREIAATAANSAGKKVRAAKLALPPAQSYTDGEIILHYECAFHIGLDLPRAGGSVDTLAHRIYLGLKENEANGMPRHDDDISKAAALAAAKCLI